MRLHVSHEDLYKHDISHISVFDHIVVTYKNVYEIKMCLSVGI